MFAAVIELGAMLMVLGGLLLRASVRIALAVFILMLVTVIAALFINQVVPRLGVPKPELTSLTGRVGSWIEQVKTWSEDNDTGFTDTSPDSRTPAYQPTPVPTPPAYPGPGVTVPTKDGTLGIRLNKVQFGGEGAFIATIAFVNQSQSTLTLKIDWYGWSARDSTGRRYSFIEACDADSVPEDNTFNLWGSMKRDLGGVVPGMANLKTMTSLPPGQTAVTDVTFAYCQQPGARLPSGATWLTVSIDQFGAPGFLVPVPR